MFDLILFSPTNIPNYYHQNFYNVKSLPKNFFESSSDIAKARILVKKCKYFHYSLYECEQGLLKLMKENNCTLVIALSDFFSISNTEMTKRLCRARTLIRLANKLKVSIRVFSLARNVNELRDKHELYWISKFLEIPKSQIDYELSLDYDKLISSDKNG